MRVHRHAHLCTLTTGKSVSADTLSDSHGTCQFGTYTAYPIRVNGHVYSGPFGMRIGSGMCRNAYQTTETTCRMACAHNPEYALIERAYSTYQCKSLRVRAISARKPSHTTTGPIGMCFGNETRPKRADTRPIDAYHLKYMPFLACKPQFMSTHLLNART